MATPTGWMIAPAQLHAARILIVDDDEAALELLRTVLGREGYTSVTCVSDSRDAARVFRETLPQAVLLDINMPHLDGFGVLEQLRALEPGGLLAVLVLTGEGDPATRVRALSAGAKDFLAKPLELAEVRVRIRNMLETRLLAEALRDQNRLLEERVRERTRELRDTRLEVVHRLAHACERRDRETGLHIVRIGLYCGQVAREGGLPEDEVEDLLHASPLHDIGKIAIPDAILLKPGPLTPEEWAVMRTHAPVGAEMLADATSRVMRTARDIARSHHEKWDGSGYPDGLKSEAIPLAARICAVCDVYDAMTSDRCYHRALPAAEVVAHVRAGAGVHFDPEVVEWFVRAQADFPAIRRAIESGEAPG